MRWSWTTELAGVDHEVDGDACKHGTLKRGFTLDVLPIRKEQDLSVAAPGLIVTSAGMQEVPATARVAGYCAVAGCADLTGTTPAVAERLPDHCPVGVDIQDRDLD